MFSILNNERIFRSAKNIKYLFMPSTEKTDHLVVVFSAFSPKGSPAGYNYIRTLQNLNVNKLFILDEQGERGCYYLGENRNFSVEASVVSLITYIANQNDIDHKNIICCGSSKGGYAALYFGIKYRFGHVISGAPQTLLGNYLIEEENSTLKFIAGDCSNNSIKYLNKLLYDVVEEVESIPDIFIHVGSGDHHYKDHVIPFKKYLDENGVDYNLDIQDYKDHGNVSFYQRILVEKLKELIPDLDDSFEINNLDIEINDNQFKLHVKSNRPSQFAWYVFKDGIKVETVWYADENTFTFEAYEEGEYHFVVFAKDEDGEVASYTTQKYNIKYIIN